MKALVVIPESLGPESRLSTKRMPLAAAIPAKNVPG
jgi:hypothetical protein